MDGHDLRVERNPPLTMSPMRMNDKQTNTASVSHPKGVRTTRANAHDVGSSLTGPVSVAKTPKRATLTQIFHLPKRTQSKREVEVPMDKQIFDMSGVNIVFRKGRYVGKLDVERAYVHAMAKTKVVGRRYEFTDIIPLMRKSKALRIQSPPIMSSAEVPVMILRDLFDKEIPVKHRVNLFSLLRDASLDRFLFDDEQLRKRKLAMFECYQTWILRILGEMAEDQLSHLVANNVLVLLARGKAYNVLFPMPSSVLKATEFGSACDDHRFLSVPNVLAQWSRCCDLVETMWKLTKKARNNRTREESKFAPLTERMYARLRLVLCGIDVHKKVPHVNVRQRERVWLCEDAMQFESQGLLPKVNVTLTSENVAQMMDGLSGAIDRSTEAVVGVVQSAVAKIGTNPVVFDMGVPLHGFLLEAGLTFSMGVISDQPLVQVLCGAKLLVAVVNRYGLWASTHELFRMLASRLAQNGRDGSAWVARIVRHVANKFMGIQMGETEEDGAAVEAQALTLSDIALKSMVETILREGFAIVRSFLEESRAKRSWSQLIDDMISNHRELFYLTEGLRYVDSLGGDVVVATQLAHFDLCAYIGKMATAVYHDYLLAKRKCPIPLPTILQLVNRGKALGVKAQSLGQRTRPGAVIVWLYGAPGTGKTTFADMLVRAVNTKLQFEPVDARFSKPRAEKFFDGYAHQKVVLVSDALAMSDKESRGNEMGFLMAAADSCPFPLHMSSVEEKGSVFFDSPVVLVTSNFSIASINPSEVNLADPFAIKRRVTLLLEQRVRPEFQTEDGRVKTDGALLSPSDVYEFTRYDPLTGEVMSAMSFQDIMDTVSAQMANAAMKTELPSLEVFFDSSASERVVPATPDVVVEAIIEAFSMSTPCSTLPTYVQQSECPYLKELGLIAAAVSALLVGMYAKKLMTSAPETKKPSVRVECDTLTSSNRSLKRRAWLENRDVVKVVDPIEPNVPMVQRESRDSEPVVRGVRHRVVRAEAATLNEVGPCVQTESRDSEPVVRSSVRRVVRAEASHAVARPESRDSEPVVRSPQTRLVRAEAVGDTVNAINEQLRERLEQEANDVVGYLRSGGIPVDHVVADSVGPLCVDIPKATMSIEGECAAPCIRQGCSDPDALKVVGSSVVQQMFVATFSSEGDIVGMAQAFNVVGRHVLVPLHTWRMAVAANFDYLLLSGVRVHKIHTSWISCYAERPELEVAILLLDKRVFPEGRDLRSKVISADQAGFVASSCIVVCRLFNRGTTACFFGSSSLRAVSSSVVDKINRDVSYKLTAAYHYPLMQTFQGMCCGVVVALNSSLSGKLIGLHCAGDPNTHGGFAAQMFREDFDDLVPTQRLDCPDAVVLSAESAAQSQGLEFVGVVDSKMAQSNFMRSSIHPSPVFGVLAPPSRAIACLCPQRGIDPLSAAQKKNIGPDISIEKHVYDKLVLYMATSLRALLSQYGLSKPHKLSVDEALNGTMESGEDRMVLKTSPGWPFNKWRAGNKHAWVTVDQSGRITAVDPLLKMRMDELRTQAEGGFVPPVVFCDSLKDEKRPIEKVKAVKTRVFAAAPVDFVAVFREYFLSFSAMNNGLCVDSPCSVGINVHGVAWKMLLKRFKRIPGDNFMAGDFGTFDGLLPSSFGMAAFEAIDALYADEHSTARMALARAVMNAVHISGDKLYRMNHGVPSGLPITSVLNSLANWAVHLYAWSQLYPLSEFANAVECHFYGDDSVLKVNPMYPQFNMLHLQTVCAGLGMKYTAASKSDDALCDYIPLDQVTFLKRSFVERDGICFAPMPKEIILDVPNWVRGTSVQEVEESLIAGADAVALELSHHPRLDFEYYTVALSNVLSEVGVLWHPPEYVDLLRRYE